jgi:hypothetical protein
MTAMKDVDNCSHLNPVTGLPIYDGQCPARRWLEALHYGPTFPEQHKNNQRISARSGPIPQTTHPAAPTAAEEPIY